MLPLRSRAIDYWDHVYGSGSGLMYPSQFAVSVLPDLPPGSSLLDCGCGNGRDSLFFSQHGLEVMGIDGSQSAIEKLKGANTKARFEMLDMGQAEAISGFAGVWARKFDLVYARFFLHAISLPSELNFWALAAAVLSGNGRVCVEARTIADMKNFSGATLSQRELITDHYRRFIDPDELVERGGRVGLKCVYRVEGQGLAKFRTEDPSIVRTIFSRA